METMRVKLTFLDEILGTAFSDPEIHRSYIASKSPEPKRAEMEQICNVKRRKSKAMSGDAWELISNDETSTGKDKQANARKRKEVNRKAVGKWEEKRILIKI